MRNFNHIRTIDLSEYLTDPLRDVKEMQAIMAAETPEVQALWAACEDCMNDQFISEATERGIARREKMLHIAPSILDTLDERRMRVHTRYNENIPYTRRRLASLLAAICGENGYTLQIVTAAFAVNVTLELSVKKWKDTVEEMLDRVLPANMVFAVELRYNPWLLTTGHTWGGVAPRTWRELKEEVFP